jgi:ribosome-binding protein aMBF1 (putative translation factor)
MPDNRFAFYVRLARWLDGLSQEDLAQASRLTLNEVVAIEAGILVPALWQVLLMADFFGLDRDWFCRLALQAGARKGVHVARIENPPAPARAASAV